MELTDKQKLLSEQIDNLIIFNKGFFNNIILKNNIYKSRYENNKLSIFDIEESIKRRRNEIIITNQREIYCDKFYRSLEVLLSRIGNNIRDFCIWILENGLQYYFASDSLDVEYLKNLIELYYISCCVNIIVTK